MHDKAFSFEWKVGRNLLQVSHALSLSFLSLSYPYSHPHPLILTITNTEDFLTILSRVVWPRMFNVHQRAMPRLKRAQAQKFIAQSDVVSYRAWECLDRKRWKHDVLLSLFECVLLCIFHVICGCGCVHMCMFTLALVLCRRDMITPLAAALDTVWLSSFFSVFHTFYLSIKGCDIFLWQMAVLELP